LQTRAVRRTSSHALAKQAIYLRADYGFIDKEEMAEALSHIGEEQTHLPSVSLISHSIFRICKGRCISYTA